MPDSSPGRKKRKFTIAACEQGVERAEKALVRLGFDSKSNFAESQRLSRSTVTKFFNQQPIQLDSFKRICEVLKLKWQEIAEITKEDIESEPIERQVNPNPDIEEGVQPVKILVRQVTVVDKASQTIKAVIKLQGHINSPPNLQILAAVLKEYGGHTVEIIDIQEGSIKLIIEGSKKDIERLLSQIQSGELTEIEGFPVEDAQLLSESSEDDESSEQKWRLVEEIVTNPIEGRDLSGADLSDADLRNARLVNANLSEADLSDSALSSTNLSRAILSGANLRGADLSGANLSGANLRGANLRNTAIDETTKLADKWRLISEISTQGAVDRDLSGANLSGGNLSGGNLSGANLSGANLSGANLSDADLSGANLRGANLRGADLSGANLSGANLRNTAIDETTKLADKWRLISEISTQGAVDRDLSRANLSGGNLSGANLSGTNLRGADLRGTNLRGADLRGADLRGAYLRDAYLIVAGPSGTNPSGANPSGADLSGADLSGADLSGADLSAANVKEARFIGSSGISELMKQDLIKRGAIFEDSPGDYRSPVPVP